MLRRWKPWLPPKQSQAVLQGGAVCFDGRETVFLHRDPATGAHADFEAALESAWGVGGPRARKPGVVGTGGEHASGGGMNDAASANQTWSSPLMTGETISSPNRNEPMCEEPP